jgi:two-component system, response regulator YesN
MITTNYASDEVLVMAKRLEVVIVDDEVQITELLKTCVMCASRNSNIHTFNDSVEAKRFIQQHQVDVLITDYKMPKYDGIQLMETTPTQVKKILISGYVSEIAEERLQKLDAVFFEKPVPMKALGKIINEQEKRLG